MVDSNLVLVLEVEGTAPARIIHLQQVIIHQAEEINIDKVVRFLDEGFRNCGFQGVKCIANLSLVVDDQQLNLIGEIGGGREKTNSRVIEDAVYIALSLTGFCGLLRH